MAPQRSKKIPHSKITAGASIMNASFPYEELIARKLGELPPLPEMADSIWQRISTELDRELPTDDNDFGGDPGPQGGSPVAGWKGWSWLLLLAVIAAVLIYLIKKPELPVEQIVPVTNQPVDSTELLPTAPGLSPPGPSSPESSSPVITDSNKSTSPDPGAVQSPLPDSAAVLQPPPVLDAAAPEVKATKPEIIAEPTIKQPDNLRPDSAGGRKRPSGIKGIRPDDYRIVPPKEKKDST
ncbi:hypothetical protein [Flavihumibacter cheonanensis]|uniref:hypothetical protein n=1 Tax=Flavihumibacter cheonanensis TaxID=1442385 RepID=UPI001EF93CBF|nr:hypothetical protein [Flavihumibacter cheonanensis]MCG7752480.1 hypothetical protein [Flavihumibacter cheonanensis]